MKNKIFCVALVAVLSGLSFSTQAEPAGKVPRIGFLLDGSRSLNSTRIESFRQGLRDLGYVEGKNINLEYRYVEGRSERRPELAKDLVRLKVDIIVVSSDLAARAVMKSTATIPIVMASIGNPNGIIASLARPGGNITGLTNYSSELVGKRLDLLKEVVPKVSRFAFLNSTESASGKSMFKDAQVAAQALGIKLQLIEIKTNNPDIDDAFRGMVKERIGAFSTTQNPLISFHRKKIFELADRNRMPAMYPEQEWAYDGGLMSYGANQVDLYRRAAVYVDKILKGAKPADLPVEQPMKFELIINLKTAKQIGLTIPPNVLARADRVIR
jgi:putative tryptophan/tyrosine transport system substrate-binding protein